MNISFERNGDSGCREVTIKIDLGLFNVSANWIPFTFMCERSYCAKLLLDRIRYLFSCLIREIREAAYIQGYKDGRGKKRKLTEFSKNVKDVHKVGW